MLKTELIVLFSIAPVHQMRGFFCALKTGKLLDSGIYSPTFKGVCMPDTNLLPLAPTHRLEFPWRSKGKDSWRHLAGADTAVMPVGYEGVMPFTSCLHGGWGEDENQGYDVWCVTSSSLGLPHGWGKGKWYFLVWWKHVQAPILTLCNIKVCKQCQREFFSEESLLMQF